MLFRSLYWVGNTGNWSDPLHWALTSGGTGGNCPPIQTDNVFFDNNSFTTSNDTVHVDSVTLYCNNMDWTGATGNPNFITTDYSHPYNLQIFGSLTLNPAMTWFYNGNIEFRSTAPGNTITTNGTLIDGYYNDQITLAGAGSTWDLMDDLYEIGRASCRERV